MPITLSKTTYILWRECPKNAWYKIHKPEIYNATELSDFEKAIIETGNDVELIARQLFPNGILIEGRDEKAQKLTKDYMTQGQEILFQPIFVKDGFLAALDVLKFNADRNTYTIYEVKATNSIDEQTHYHDLAFQFCLLKKFGYKVESANLIHLNPDYVRSDDIDVDKLFLIEDITEKVEGMLDSVSIEMGKALEYISKEKEPEGSCCCLYKGRSRHCNTFKHANPQVPEYSVHDLHRIGNSKGKLQELIDSDILHIKDVPDDFELSEAQRNQVDAHILDKILLDKIQVASELEKLSFPLYFLDYETCPCAIPRFKGFSPYQQIPFQYSLHILEAPDAELKHKEFLYEKADDPSRALATSLQNDIGDKGSVIVWNKRFECGINEQIAKRLPEFELFMSSVNSRVYDLEDVFRKQFYVHKDFKGRTSIKKVLPVLVPELSHKNLNIQEGGTASQKWDEITASTDKAEQEKIIHDLKEYCKLDTYAMFAIWKHLYDLIAVKA